VTVPKAGRGGSSVTLTASQVRIGTRTLVRAQSTARLTGPFWALMVFTFILFIGPQYFVPGLSAIRPALIAAGAAVALYLFDRLAHGGRLSVTVPPVRLLAVLVLLVAMSIPTSLWPGGSFELLPDFVKSVLIGLLLCNVLDSTRRIKLMLASLVCWGIVMALTALRNYSAGQLKYGGERIAGYDSPLAGNPNDLALTLNLVVALAIGLYFATRRRAFRIVLLGAIMFMVGGMVVTFSRSGFLTLVATGLAFLWECVRRRRVGAVAGALAVAAVLFAFLPSGYGDRMYSIIDFKADPSGSAQARWDGIWLGLEFIKERPIFGFGLGAHGIEFADRGQGWTGIHNAVVQVGADAGFAAMVVFVLIIAQTFRQLASARRRFREANAREHDSLAMGVHLSLVGFAFSTVAYPVAYHFYLYYIIGFAVALRVIASNMARQPAPLPITRHARLRP
jgi:O-antigen ligase